MDDTTATFHRLRPRLQAIAYRMLSSHAEAEEVVQDAWLRWHDQHQTDGAGFDSAEAWLVTVTTRLAIDRLRAAKLQRAHYTGFWLPEPVLNDGPPSPEAVLQRADDVSVAFLTLLERLSPEARAAYLLREVFDADYADVARIVDKNEAACRQLVHRAKQQLADERPRYAVTPAVHRRLLGRFAQAMHDGDIGALSALLADDAVLISDGGGKVPSFGKPIEGGDRIARLLAVARIRGEAVRVEVLPMNGGWGLLRFLNGALESAQWFEMDGERIQRVHVQRNPDKLAQVAATFA